MVVGGGLHGGSAGNSSKHFSCAKTGLKWGLVSAFYFQYLRSSQETEPIQQKLGTPNEALNIMPSASVANFIIFYLVCPLRPDYLEATLSGSLMYLSSLRGRILSVAKDTTTGKENISLLMCNIELISNAAMQLNTWHKSHSEEDTTHISECVGRLTAFLKELVVNRNVIGGSMFGNTMLRRADMEFHVSHIIGIVWGYRKAEKCCQVKYLPS